MSTRDLKMQVLLDLRERVLKPLTAIRGSSAETSKEVKALRDQVKNLQAQNDKIDSFKTLSKQTAIVGTELKSAKDRLKAFDAAMTATDKPTRKLVEDWKAAKKEVNDLNAKHASMIDRQRKLVTVLGESGIKTNALSAHQRELKTSITETSAALGQQEAKLKAVNAKLQQQRDARAKYDKTIAARDKLAGAGVAMAGAGGGALYGAARVIQPGLDFEESMSSVQALARLDKTSAQFKSLRQQARDLGAATSFTATEAANAQGFLAMAGFDPSSILNAMPGMLDLSKAGRVDLARSADLASNILTGFKLQADQMNRVGDTLVGTFTRSNTNLEMLGDTMKYAAPIAAGLNIDLETTAAMAGKLGDAGIQASMAGTGLRAIMSRLAAPPKMARDALAELNIETKDARGNLRPIVDILTELQAKTAKMGSAKRSGLFKHIAGEEAFSALSVLTEQAGSGKLQELIATLRAANGEAAKNAQTMADNARGDLKTLQSAWEDFGITMFDTQNGPIRGTIQTITDSIRKVNEWTKANPELTATLVKIAAVTAIIVTVLGALALGAAAVLGPFAALRFALTAMPIISAIASGGLGLLTGAFGFLGTAISTVTAFMLANPIVLAVMLLALAAFLIYKNWEPIKAFFMDIWESIKAGFKAFVDAHITAWQSIIGAVGQAADWIKKKFSGLVDWFTGLPAAFLELGSQMVNGILNGLSAGWGKLKAKIAELSQMLPEPVRNALGFTAKIENSGALAPAPALVTGSAIKPSANNSMVIHSQDKFDFNVYAAPGQSAEDIGKQVRKEIDARDRQRAATARARFTDRD